VVCEDDEKILDCACSFLSDKDPLVTSLAAVVIMFELNKITVPSLKCLQQLIDYCPGAIIVGDYYKRSTALRVIMAILQKKNEIAGGESSEEMKQFTRSSAENIANALASFDTDPVPKPGIEFYANTLYNVFADMWKANVDNFIEEGSRHFNDLLDCLMVARVPKLQLACSMILSHVLTEEVGKKLESLDSSSSSTSPTSTAALLSAPACLKRSVDILLMTLVRGCTPFAHLLLWNIVHDVFRVTPREWAPVFVALLRESDTFDQHMHALMAELPETPSTMCYPTENPLEKCFNDRSSDSFDDMPKIIQETSAWQLLEVMQWFPTVIRSWSVNCNEKALSTQVHSWACAASHRLNELAFPDGSGRYTSKCEMDDVIVIESCVSLPSAYPLEPISVDTRRATTGGLSESMWRKWHLLLHTMLSNGEECGLRDKNYIVGTVKNWQDSVEKHFENVEPCPVCYSIFSPDGRLPTMTCRTCHHKYHASCMAKWFSTSHKTVCPMCKSDFSLRA